MEALLDGIGHWLALGYAVYGLALVLIPALAFLYVPLLAAVVWGVVAEARGRTPWPFLPGAVRRWGLLALEIVFGLINPAIYLTVLSQSMPAMRRDAEHWWVAPLTTLAWLLLTAIWTLRIFGGTLDSRRTAVRLGVRTVLVSALLCLWLFGVKDLRLLSATLAPEHVSLAAVIFGILPRLCPFYLIPAVLLWRYLRSTWNGEVTLQDSGLFLLPGRPARLVATGVAGVALVTVAVSLHRSSDAQVRALVTAHRASIAAAAAHHDVDPRLVAAIVYVTHRDQLSPFRDTLERVLLQAWTMGYAPQIGANETLLNRPLDVSAGLAQIKPRTAQTALLLAAGHRPNVGQPESPAAAYFDSEPINEAWTMVLVSDRRDTPSVSPANRAALSRALLEARSNLEMCALILSLYQRQWEMADPAFSLRARPDILATLYQIGFARSTPHAQPRSNAFGARVQAVHDEPWIAELFGNTRRPAPDGSLRAAVQSSPGAPR